MIRLIVLLFLALSLNADDNQPGGFIGISGVQDGRVQLDLAVPVVRVSSSSSGVHLGFGYQQRNDLESKTLGHTQVFSYRGHQIGYFADLGRGYFALGYEQCRTVDQTVVPYGGGFTTVVETETTKRGGYGKFGLRGRLLGVYVGYGTASKVSVGLSFHF